MTKEEVLQRMVIREYRYHLDTLADVSTLASDAEMRFKEAVLEAGSQKVKDILFDIQKPEIKNISKNNDKEFKELYRKVVVLCHPDKTQGFEDEYKKVALANKENDWGMLINTAEQLGIDVSEKVKEKEQDILLSIEKLKAQRHNLETSTSWIWDLSNDEEKSHIVSLFIDGLYKKS